MSTVLVSPQKPWRPTVKNLLPEILGMVFTAASTLFIVSVTELKGKLGFAITLILMSLITTSTISWIRRDRKAAVSSVSGVLVFVAATFVLMPLMSILYEIIRLGFGGLSWGIFTTDMSKTSADAPIIQGGLLHAIIGTLYLVLFATIASAPIGFLTALYIVEVKGKFAGSVRFFVQAMSGVPSIVAGLFILSSLVYPVTKELSGIMGSFALTILNQSLKGPSQAGNLGFSTPPGVPGASVMSI
jgi:phosphate transport system permease protein